MGYLDDLRAAAEWVEDRWGSLPPSVRSRILELVGELQTSAFYVDLARSLIVPRLNELTRRYNQYVEDPLMMLREFTDYIRPGTRYGELAEQFRPSTEEPDGYGPEISRPIILIPGMVGTRLMKTEESRSEPSSSLPPDLLMQWMETQFRSRDSYLLSGLPRSAQDVLLPALRRISDRHLYNPRMLWDPDSPYAMINLMNKTATERGVLLCPDDTSATIADDFATEVAESMTFNGLLEMWCDRGVLRGIREVIEAAGYGDMLVDGGEFSQLREARRARGWCQPVWQVSKDWLLPLERNFGEVVYAFGYDWRQPLSASVDSLVAKIERVRRHHGGRRPLLVSHSYGGLLARAAARIRPDNVAGIVQVFSPTAGSVKLYTNFKRGGGGPIPPGWTLEEYPGDREIEDYFSFDVLSTLGLCDPLDIFFGIILGWDSTAFAATAAGVYGIYSLLPNNIERYNQSSHWLRIENDPDLQGLISSSTNVYELYRQFDRPWGLIDGDLWGTSSDSLLTGDQSERAWNWLQSREGVVGSMARLLVSGQEAGLLRLFTRETLNSTQIRRVRERVERGISEAEQTDRVVGNYVHPNTWSLYALGSDTDVGFNIRRTDSSTQPFATHRIVSEAGDGSLEEASARALSSSFFHENLLSGVGHANAMETHHEARALLVKTVYLALVAAHRAGS